GSSVIATLPRVSYIKAIDIWIIVCLLFVIGALLEFAMASSRARRNQQLIWEHEVRNLVRQELARTMCPCPDPFTTRLLGLDIGPSCTGGGVNEFGEYLYAGLHGVPPLADFKHDKAEMACPLLTSDGFLPHHDEG
ncbi:unnamed protein product, partial [Protopolystoma xenopodis]